MLAVTIVAAAAVLLGAGTAIVPTDAVFSNVSAPWMPAAPLPGGLTSSWFCPGVPAAGEEGRSGTVTVFNSGDVALRGRLTVLRVEGEPVTQDIEVAPFASFNLALDTVVDSPYAAAFVEIDGGGGLVEQRAVDPAGESVAACSNTSAAQWYFAAGDTLDGSVEALVLSNPHDDPAVVDISLATERGIRVPEQVPEFRRAGAVRAGDRRRGRDHRRPDARRGECDRHPWQGRPRQVPAPRHRRADRLRDVPRHSGGA